MLSCLATAVHKVQAVMERSDLAAATTAVYDLWHKQICDVYLELIEADVQLLNLSEGEEPPGTWPLWQPPASALVAVDAVAVPAHRPASAAPLHAVPQ